MRIALFGYGAMGRLVETKARAAGHEIACTFASRDARLSAEETAERLRGSDVAIDFSAASAVLRNATASAIAGVPLVEGTTGWRADEAEVRRVIESRNGALIFGANFSIGVNLFYRIAAAAAALFQNVESYDPFIEEAHHARKKDAPSGTAIRLREIVSSGAGRDVPVSSTRAGYIPGTHRVGFDSLADQITLTHTARSREGFASGALLAAEWIRNRKGVFEFSEVFEEILLGRK